MPEWRQVSWPRTWTALDAFRVYVATLILFIPALLGAKLLYVLTHWPLYRNDPTRIWKRQDGGAAQYRGLIVVLVFSVPLLAALHLPFGAFWDVAIFTTLVLMIFGRIGCLMNGCCAGRHSQSWMGVHLPNRSGEWTKQFPTQFLEAGWAILLLIVAMVARGLTPFPGALERRVPGSPSARREEQRCGGRTEPGACDRDRQLRQCGAGLAGTAGDIQIASALAGG